MWQSAKFLDFDIYVTESSEADTSKILNDLNKHNIFVWLKSTSNLSYTIEKLEASLNSKNTQDVDLMKALRESCRCEHGARYTFLTPSDSEISTLFELLTDRSKILSRHRSTFYYPFEFDPNKLEHEDGIKPNEELLFKLDTSPLAFADLQGEEKLKQTELYSQNYLYYSSRVRKRFFSLQGEAKNETKCFREYQFEPNNISIRLKDDSPECRLSAVIERLSLIQHGLNKQSYLMAVTVRPTYEEKLIKQLQRFSQQFDITNQSWFWVYIYACKYADLLEVVRHAQVAYWLKFTNQVRILYPTFIEQKDEDKISEVELLLEDKIYEIFKDGRTKEGDNKSVALRFFPEDIEQPVSEHILRLASLFFVEENRVEHITTSHEKQNAIIKHLKLQCTYQYDSRLYTNSCYVLAGSYPDTRYGRELLDKLTMLATQVDSFETLNCHQDGGYAYHREFLQKLADVQWYTRWKNTTAISGFNEYAAVSVGFGGFYQNIGYRHWTHNYHYMVAYAALTREVLQSLIRQMELATLQMTATHLDEKPLSHYRKIRRNFINFMNQYWFDTVSHEQQGLEIFEHIKRAFNLDNHFDKMKDKIAWADDYMESWRNTYFVDKADKTSMAALIFAAIAIITAFPVLGAFDNYNIVERFAFGLLLVASPFILTNYLVVRNTKVLLNKVASHCALFRHRHFSSFAKLTTSFAVVVLALALLL